MIAKTLLALSGLVLGSIVFQAPASADDFSHSGGFVCGELGATNDRLVGGDHRTQFNILNGNSRAVTVDLELSLTFPAAEPAANGATFTPGAIAKLQSVMLQPGQAVMIDCRELEDAAVAIGEVRGDDPPYFAGLLTARSKRLLDVTRTQTAGQNGADVSSISVTEIKGRRR
jgi:hypothetical protein